MIRQTQKLINAHFEVEIVLMTNQRPLNIWTIALIPAKGTSQQKLVNGQQRHMIPLIVVLFPLCTRGTYEQ